MARKRGGSGAMARALANDVIETMIELMELPGPTGQEEPILAWCRETWAVLGAELCVSRVGNVTARIRGHGPKLLVQGHADEIGYVVKSIDERGFVFLADGQAGGSRALHHRHPIGQTALILGRERRVEGVFATVTGHIIGTRPDEGPLLAMNDVFVDVGAGSREEAISLGVHVGAGVVWNPSTKRIGSRIIGKAIDDRVALALMTHLLKSVDRESLTYDLTLAATVQEEIGLIGALSLTNDARFDLAIAIDNGPIADYPGVDRREMPVTLGAGPTLVYKDSWAHYDRRILHRLRDVACSNGIAVQEATFPAFGSDGAALIRRGVPT